MQIENNKEEVPFGHYEALFRQADPVEIAERLGVKWDGKAFTVTLLGRTYAISHPVYAIRELTIRGTDCHDQSEDWSRNDTEDVALPGGAGQKRILPRVGANCQPALPVQTFLLRYLLEAKKVVSGGNWLTFREMPWGELYIKPYTGRVLTRAAFTFGTRLAKFKAAAEKMGGIPVNHGDAGYQFQLVEGYHMQILVWEGDEEFPPNAQVLYSDNFADGFAAEDRVVAGDILISAIKENM